MPEITASTEFEKRIRDAACILRGNPDASGYKHIVLGFDKSPGQETAIRSGLKSPGGEV